MLRPGSERAIDGSEISWNGDPALDPGPGEISKNGLSGNFLLGESDLQPAMKVTVNPDRDSS